MANDEYTLGLGFNEQYTQEASRRITELAVKYGVDGVTGIKDAKFCFKDQGSQASFLAEIADLQFVETIIFPDREVPRKTLEQLARIHARIAQEQGETQ